MATPETFRFRDFELDVAAYELRRQGRAVRLERRPMDLLILLVERRRQLVTRGDIIDRLWGKDVFVDVETGINTVISKVRQALRDSANASAFVETVPGKGYRFIAPVEVVSEPNGDRLPASADARSEISRTRGDALETKVMATGSTRTDTGVDPPPADGPKPRIPPRVTLALLVVGLVVGSVTWAWLTAGRTVSRVTLAVLPFENLSGDSDRDYLADGLAEETIASLGQIDPDHLSVIGRTSMMIYKHTTKSLAAIGHELHADYLVESSLRAEGNRLRITSRLIRVRDQVQVWSTSYDREPTSMLGLQRELSTSLAEQIRIRLDPERVTALARRQTLNADAYDLYLRGRYFWNQLTPATNKRAVEYYERAIAFDPNYALAWSGIADALLVSPSNSDVAPLEVSTRAREAAGRAARAQPDLAEAKTSLGYVNFLFDWNWAAAESAFRRAITLDPSYVLAHRMLGHLLSQTGRQEEAQSVMRRVRDLEPLYAMNHAISSQVAFQARDYPAAVEHARQAIVVGPEFWIGYVQLAQVYEQLGKADLALEAVTNAARLSGGNSKAISLRGHLLATLGRSDEARDVLRTLTALSRDHYVPPYAMALVDAGLGEREAVFEALNRAFEVRDVHLIFLAVDPKWDPYRADPRFETLLVRCGFTRSTRTTP